ncbi:NAD(P)/FAD-dependent oxidoreductase [Flavihumibacter cheonanensis]|nr:NAD(P)/FAD-dependent oxidoreductase [Flavihumibacter cheonanensis]MCG7754330.1 NAD(P)/FAD-dependent oxidoreductase [Flavihumibacter cheonanensis]
MKQDKTFDVIIIGGSYSGLSAAMALGRALRKVQVIDSGNPCNKQTPHSHNFLTNDGKTPKEITSLSKQQVKQYPTVRLLDGFASKGTQTAEGFTIQTETGELFSSRKLIVATGIKDSMPPIPGFAESWGISVLHCPYCHGYEVRNQTTGILANGDAAFELASLISNWTKDLTIYTNGSSLLSDQQKAKLEKNQIGIVETEINRLDHTHGYINNIVFKNGSKIPVKAIYARLPFVQHSSIPQELGAELTQDGFIKIDNAHRTSVQGLYACGDNTTKMRTVANAVSMGTTAAFMVNKELIEEDF